MSDGDFLCHQATFTFEAGRRCDSGQGIFRFKTKAVKEIFHIIDAAVKEKQSKKKQQRLSLTSVSSETSTASSQKLPSAAFPRQESSDEKPSSGGRVKPLKETDSNQEVRKRKENRDRKGRNSPSGAVPRAPPGAERNLPTTDDREGVGEIVYATVKYPKGKATKVNVEEPTVNPTKYRDSYSDDSSIDPVYENVSDIESLLSFEEEPSFLKDIQKSLYENSQGSLEDQNLSSSTSASAPDYENVVIERSQQTSEGEQDDCPANEKGDLHQTPPGTTPKERDTSLSSGASKVTKAKFPAGIQEVLTDLYSKELSKTREG
ncbi:docking protein 2-like, partial [Chiloscyllium plagiosum]|uniref:docking protein 2-like n=1 Tax=Chiloscyllium plagiosum TaxID=36176 RepID=UPI001CB8427D